MNDHERNLMREREFVQKLEKLHQFLHGAHLVCDHENSSATFHHACHIAQEIIAWVNNSE